MVGVITAFAIPNFQKGMERNYERQALLSLEAINAAQQVYKARYDSYWPPAGYVGGTTINDFNTNLQLSIAEQGVTYSCSNTHCDATRTGKWRVRRLYGLSITNLTIGVYLFCLYGGGACPTVPYLL